MHDLPFILSLSHTESPLELIHTDVWGPFPIQFTSSFKYHIQFLDDYSQHTWIYPLKHKGEFLSAFMQFKTLVEKQFDKRVKILQNDQGGEFRSFTQYLQNEGIVFRQSCPYTSAQNGRVERRHRLTLLDQACMPLHYWWEAFQTVVYLINRLPSTVLANQSLFSILYGKVPNYTDLRAFGCACYSNTRPYNTHKFSFHTTKCVFLIYNGQHKGYKFLSSTGRIYVSRHVVFNEDDFPFRIDFLNTRQPETITNLSFEELNLSFEELSA